MQLLELRLKNFGKFSGQRICFHPGVNIISGENEMGKTTIHSFIRGMLFGITAQRGRAAKNDEYTLREPWENPYYYAGTLKLESGGKVFRIERNFQKRDKSVSLVCETDGEEMSVEHGDLEVLLEGMNEQAFRNTIFITQKSSATDAGLAEELKNYMTNLREAGDAGIYVETALKSLNEKKKRTQSIIRQEEAGNEEQAEQISRRMEYVRQELDSAEREVQERRMRSRELEERWKLAVMQYKKAADAARQQHKESEDVIRDSIGRSRREEAERRAALRKKRRALQLTAAFLSLAAFLGCIFLPSVTGKAAVAAVWLLCMLAGVWYVIRSGGSSQNGEMDRDTYREPGPETGRIREPSYGTETNAAKEAAKLAEGLESLQGERQKMSWGIEHLKAEIAEKKILLGNLEESLEEAHSLKGNLESLKKELEALELADRTIRTVSREVYLTLAEQVEEKASGIIREITEGKYTSISLDENMDVKVNTPDRLLKLSQVSRGTADQMYFAVRMAAGEVFTKGASMPVILDEAFAMYDDRRLFNTLKWLKKSGRQVILFTCHRREEEMMKRI